MLAASTPLKTAPAVLEIGIVLLLAVVAGWLACRLSLPAILGYLVGHGPVAASVATSG